jgi:hypothetical protein
LLSNFVLRDFDRHFIGKHAKLVRYADDFVIFAGSEEECLDLLTEARSLLAAKGHGVPDPGPGSKTIIANPDEPIEFLGYDIVPRIGTGADHVSRRGVTGAAGRWPPADLAGGITRPRRAA